MAVYRKAQQHRLGRFPKPWLRFWGLGLSTTYGVFLFFVALCSTTTILPTATDHDAHHQHDHPHAPSHSALPDTCTCVLQALMATALPAMGLFAVVCLLGAVFLSLVSNAPSFASYAHISIRAPPGIPS